MMFLVASVLVAMAATVSFLPSLSGNFVFDDAEAILNNPDVLPTSPWYNAFQNDFWGKLLQSNTSHKSYRPLTILTFRLNYAWSGELKPVGFHVANLGLHVICCIVLLYTYNFIIQNGQQSSTVSPVSLIASLLFASHPVHSENVAGIVGRADILCAIFFYLAFLAYTKCIKCTRQSNVCIGLSHWGHKMTTFAYLTITAIFAVISMLFKEQGITVLGLCIFYDLLLLKRSLWKELNVVGVSTFVGRCVFLSFFGVVVLGFRWWIMGGSAPIFQRMDNPGSFAETWWQRVLNFNYVYAINAWILLHPMWLCYDWSMGCIPVITGMTDARVLVIILFWVFILAMLFTCHRQLRSRQKILPVSLALLIIPFLPASNLFFRVGFVVAERVLFLPSSGYCLLVAMGFCHLANSKYKKVVNAMGSILLLLFILRSRQRSAEWLTEETLFHSGLKVCPMNAKVHYNIAKKASDAGLQKVAIEEYREALKLFPQYDQAMNNLANILKDHNHLPEAEQLLLTAVKIRQDFAAAWMNLGIVQSGLRKYGDAEHSYRTALGHRTHYPDCYYNLGNLYLERKRYNDAYEAWKNATVLKPTHLASWNNMIIMFDNQGDLEQAKYVAEAALELLPEESSIHFNMANVLGKLGEFDKSEEHFKTAISLRPDNAAYFTNLGVLYHRWKRYNKAEYAYRQALKLDHKSTTARNNLHQVLEMKAKPFSN